MSNIPQQGEKKEIEIPIAEIENDILETEREIAAMTTEADWLEKTPMTDRDAKWNHMRASARRSGIEERKDFIKKLQAILESRK